MLDNAHLVMIAPASSATAMIAARRTEIWLTEEAYRRPGNRAKDVNREPGMVLIEK